MRAARALVMAVAAAAFLMLLFSGPGTRLGWWTWQTGLGLLKWAAYCGLAAAAPPMILLEHAKAVPPIHDITTDVFDPPQFVALAAIRTAAPNGLKYGGMDIAAQQQKGYPDIKSVILKDPPQKATQSAIDAARSCGWEIVSSDAPTGRIEATDTSLWFGFKDDIIVRVRPDGSGSRVDVRSVSRVGVSDIGANAERVRGYLGRLQ